MAWGRVRRGLSGVREELWLSARQHANNVTLCFPPTEEGALIHAWITHFFVNFKLHQTLLSFSSDRLSLARPDERGCLGGIEAQLSPTRTQYG